MGRSAYGRSPRDAALMEAVVSPGAQLAGGGVIASSGALSQEVLHITREGYLEAVASLREGGFDMCADLCAVDYLRHLDRPLPDGVVAERFEVVVNLVSLVATPTGARACPGSRVGPGPPKLVPALPGLGEHGA